MNGCFHWRRHERSPYQYIGLQCFHCNCWVTCCDSQLLLHILENLRHVLMVCDLHVLKMCLCVHRPHRYPWASLVRRFIPVSLFPGVGMLCVFLSPHLRMFDWILAWVSPHRFPGARMTASFFIDIHQIDWIAQNLRRVLPRTQRVVQHQIHGSRLRHRRIRWLWFCHRWTFIGSRFLSSLWHGTLLPDRIRKKITEMAAREHREIHNVEQTKKMIPFITCETPFCQHVSELVLVST